MSSPLSPANVPGLQRHSISSSNNLSGITSAAPGTATNGAAAPTSPTKVEATQGILRKRDRKAAAVEVLRNVASGASHDLLNTTGAKGTLKLVTERRWSCCRVVGVVAGLVAAIAFVALGPTGVRDLFSENGPFKFRVDVDLLSRFLGTNLTEQDNRAKAAVQAALNPSTDKTVEDSHGGNTYSPVTPEVEADIKRKFEGTPVEAPIIISDTAGNSHIPAPQGAPAVETKPAKAEPKAEEPKPAPQEVKAEKKEPAKTESKADKAKASNTTVPANSTKAA